MVQRTKAIPAAYTGAHSQSQGLVSEDVHACLEEQHASNRVLIVTH